MNDTLKEVKNANISDSVIKLLKKILKTLDEYEVTIENGSAHWRKEDDEVIWATGEVIVTHPRGVVVLYDW